MPFEHLSAVCALRVVGQFLAQASNAQSLAYMSGLYGRVPALHVLSELHALVRCGVCSETRVLEPHETPDLTRLLAQLPEDMRMVISGAIAAERLGLSNHYAMVPALALDLPTGFATAVRFDSAHHCLPGQMDGNGPSTAVL